MFVYLLTMTLITNSVQTSLLFNNDKYFWTLNTDAPEAAKTPIYITHEKN